jgi:hypothetical protein
VGVGVACTSTHTCARTRTPTHPVHSHKAVRMQCTRDDSGNKPTMITGWGEIHSRANRAPGTAPSLRLAKLRLYEVTMEFLASLGTSERFHWPMQGPQALASTVAPAPTRVCEHKQWRPQNTHAQGQGLRLPTTAQSHTTATLPSPSHGDRHRRATWKKKYHSAPHLQTSAPCSALTQRGVRGWVRMGLSACGIGTRQAGAHSRGLGHLALREYGSG